MIIFMIIALMHVVEMTIKNHDIMIISIFPSKTNGFIKSEKLIISTRILAIKHCHCIVDA